LRIKLNNGIGFIIYDQTERNRKWKIQDGGLQTTNVCVCAPKQDINEIPTAIPMFSVSRSPMELVSLLYGRTGRNWKWEIQDGGLQNSNTSACTIDINEIPSAVFMFWGSSYSTELVSLLYDQTGRNRK